jgi:metal-responsive CopG/Arc/MetJ family transcriptional regulator
MSDYTSISLPKKFIERIRKYIEAHPEEGYSSITDFIKEATRKHIHAKSKEITDKAKALI